MKQLIFTTLFLLFSLTAQAEPPQYGLIHLSASANAEVNNDELIVQLRVFEQGKQTSQLTDLVNKKSALVLDALKNFAEIDAKTTQYNTRPNYKNGKITHWQVSQNLQLKTSNFKQMSQLIADISTLAQVQSMQFQVSKQQADKVKHDLMKQAIERFQQKAKLVTEQFNEQAYKLVSLSVNEGQHQPMPMMRQSAMMEADSFGKAAAPAALQGGSNTVSVSVNGSIEIYRPVQ